MRLPYISLALMAALSLAGCAHAQFPLPSTTTIDDQVGISVEIAYQAAALAEETAIRAGFVSPGEAGKLLVLDNQAYDAVCYTRTAYNIANGFDPMKRVDGCRPETKSNKYTSYAQAAAAALDVIRDLVQGTKAVQSPTVG